ncbi:recombination-associated protein RdgC [Pseudomonas sp. EMN2]|uniref:recombination-associated protein RdgC n=1 Tax=Pseudomonas sp. EMN2 TaxID=2615212 RepID=UPI00129A3D31|nr:recombination-associated protein RdgC [Pseudomonas sp. EMN2]
MNLFPKLIAYHLTDASIDLSQSTLQAALEKKPARDPSDTELSTFGFITPLPVVDGQVSTVLAHKVSDVLVIKAEQSLRKVPAQAIDAELNKRVSALEQTTDTKVSRAERKVMKDQVVMSLIGRVIPKKIQLTAFILPADNLILVSASRPADAENLLSTVREVLGSLPVRPVTVQQSPTAVMTDWLKKKTFPAPFFPLGEASLRGVEEGKANLSDVDLTGDEVQMHLASGLLVRSILLAWSDKMVFRVNDRLLIDKIRLSDTLMADIKHNAGDDQDKLQTWEASVILTAKSLKEMLDNLFAAFGGTNVPGSIA